MKAIVITEPGEPEVLQLKQRETPTPGPLEVLIKVAAAGVNRPDVSQRKGNYPPPTGAPADIPGLEVSGIVVEVGNDVKTWEAGDEVCALVSGGGYAEYVTAPIEQCLIIPEGVSLEDAASLPETFFTVWNNVFHIGKFKPGERVLIHGGSSGIGVAAIQMVKAMAGIVYTTAGSDEKCRFCEQLGAAHAFNYRTSDFEEEVFSVTEGKGVDIILDMVGGSYAAKNIRLLGYQGRLIMINAMDGKMGSVDLIRIMKNNLTITGSTLRPQSIAYKGHLAKTLMNEIWPFFPEKIKPIIHTRFALSDAAKAHALMERSSHIGKILLVP
ncbi:NAD(P)H-quinone oxidoreductase [Lunatibacter salilacus]|uniref:NAD(P)H-quinone oxidoreductase n=1 Tax=Lunatibacter salilacus TaxID=2483804 RepID=UPI00131E4E91|nr:NAD(P)H-quinone oxidoreductase [Lunatibacter salilacus]